jgi:DNA-directed RNA polymerase subunit L
MNTVIPTNLLLNTPQFAKFSEPRNWLEHSDNIKHLYLRVIHQWAGFTLRRVVATNHRIEAKEKDPNTAARSRYAKMLESTEWKAETTQSTSPWSRLLVMSAYAVLKEAQKVVGGERPNLWLADSLLDVNNLVTEYAEFGAAPLIAREKELGASVKAAKYSVDARCKAILERSIMDARSLFAGITTEVEHFEKEATEHLDRIEELFIDAVNDVDPRAAAQRVFEAIIRTVESARRKYESGQRTSIKTEVAVMYAAMEELIAKSEAKAATKEEKPLDDGSPL